MPNYLETPMPKISRGTYAETIWRHLCQHYLEAPMPNECLETPEYHAHSEFHLGTCTHIAAYAILVGWQDGSQTEHGDGQRFEQKWRRWLVGCDL